MASGYERQVLLFNVQGASLPKGAPIRTLAEMAAMLHTEWREKRAITRLQELEAEDLDQDTLEAARKRPNNAVYIQDMLLRPDGCDILLTLGDAAEADPTIVNLKSFELQPVRKGTDGGVGFSAHLSMSFKKSSGTPTQYRAVLERMPNLGRNTVINYVNRILRNHTRGNDEYRFVEDGTGRDLAYRPKLLHAARPSRTLRNAVRAGRFSEVVLIQRSPMPKELDENERFRVTEKRLKVGLEDVPADDAGRLQWLNRLKRQAKLRDFDEVQVRLKSFGGGADMSSRFSTEVADAADAVFSRHEDITFDSETGQCHKRIVERIRDPLVSMLHKDALWR